MPAKGSKWDPVSCRYVSAEELALRDAAAATAYAESRGWEVVGGAGTTLPPPNTFLGRVFDVGGALAAGGGPGRKASHYQLAQT